MKTTKTSLLKQNLKSTKLMGLFGLSMALGLAACGNNNKSPGNQAKSATDAVKDKEETRAEVEMKLDQQIADLKTHVSDLEMKEKKETAPAIQTAEKARLDRLKAFFTEATDHVIDLKKSANAEWKTKRDAAAASLENAKTKVASALDRQKLKENVNQKLDKMQAKINSLKDRASKASTDEKQKIDESRAKLESKYDQLKAENNKFQTSTEEKWDDFKDGFSKSFKELSDTFKGLFE